MEQATRPSTHKNVMGWQMVGATSRTSPVGTWAFAMVDEPTPVRRVSKARVQVAARPTRKKTLYPRLLPAVLAAAMVSSLIGGVAVARFPRDPATMSKAPSYPMNVAVTVQSGDSLWSIARRFGNGDRYILDRVDEIASVNDISHDVALLPGQQVWITAYTPEERAHITARRIVR